MREKGFVQLFVIAILLFGIAVAVYLTQFTQVFKPKASENPATIQTEKKKDIQIWFSPNMYYGSDDPLNRRNPVDASTFWDDEEKLKDILPMISSFGLQPVKEYSYIYPKMQAMLRKFKVPVDMSIAGVNSFNSAYCDNHNAGELTASFEIQTIKEVEAQGIHIDILTMDDPISRTIANGEYPTSCNYTVDESVQEVIDAMKAIHTVFPDKKIGMNVNFANWRYAGTQIWGGPERKNYNIADYKDVLEKLLPAIKGAGEELAFLHVDYPYEHAHPNPNPYPNVDWMKRLLDLEIQVKSHGVRFGVFFNSDGINVSDQKEFNGVTNYIREYRERGGSPDNYVVKSWGTYPQHMLPASEPYTYTYLLITLMRMIDTPPVGSLDGIVQCTTVVGWACDNDTPAKQTGIQFNADGKYIGFVFADQPGEEGVALQCGGHSAHRFKFDLPPQLQDNTPHNLNIFAINSNSFGQNTQLPGSPMIMQCVKPSSSPPPSVSASPSISSSFFPIVSVSPSAIVSTSPALPPVVSSSPSSKMVGDLDQDGDVDIFDFNLFLQDYKNGNLRSDLNHDGKVDIFDFNIMLKNFGS